MTPLTATPFAPTPLILAGAQHQLPLPALPPPLLFGPTTEQNEAFDEIFNRALDAIENDQHQYPDTGP